MSAKLQIANCLVWCRNVSVIAVISQRGMTGHIIDYLVHTPLGRAVQSVVSHVHHFFFGYGLVQITLRLSPLSFTLIKYRVEVLQVATNFLPNPPAQPSLFTNKLARQNFISCWYLPGTVTMMRGNFYFVFFPDKIVIMIESHCLFKYRASGSVDGFNLQLLKLEMKVYLVKSRS